MSNVCVCSHGSVLRLRLPNLCRMPRNKNRKRTREEKRQQHDRKRQKLAEEGAWCETSDISGISGTG